MLAIAPQAHSGEQATHLASPAHDTSALVTLQAIHIGYHGVVRVMALYDRGEFGRSTPLQ